MQKFSYHCHTNFAGIFDGHNSASEMIKRAEELGFTEIGISNHFIYHHNMALTHKMFFNNFDQALDIYRRNIDDIREAGVKSKIRVYAGYEANYYPSPRWCDDFERMRDKLGADYYIGAIHDLCDPTGEDILNLYDIFEHKISDQAYRIPSLYAGIYDVIISAIASGYFDFIAHIDIFKIFNLGIGEQWLESKIRLLDALEKHHQAYELNTAGWNKSNEQNPEQWFITEAHRRNIPVLISDDAHSVQDLGQYYDRAEAILTEIGYQNRWTMPHQ